MTDAEYDKQVTIERDAEFEVYEVESFIPDGANYEQL